jgi:hypothetical protein
MDNGLNHTNHIQGNPQGWRRIRLDLCLAAQTQSGTIPSMMHRILPDVCWGLGPVWEAKISRISTLKLVFGECDMVMYWRVRVQKKRNFPKNL